MAPGVPPFFGMAPAALPIFGLPPTVPPFFSVYFLLIKPLVLFRARYRKTRRYTGVVSCEVLSSGNGKTGRYTNIVCCEVKIVHSERNPGLSAASKPFRGEHTAIFVSFLLLILPTLCCVAP